MTLDDVRRDVAAANRVLAEVGLATGVLASLGHASMRVPQVSDRFVVKGRGYRIDALAVMGAEDMVVCDLDGFITDGPAGVTQCFEVQMHACMYKLHPEVQAVVHVHPRFAVLMSTLEIPLVPMCQEGAQLVRHPLPVYQHCATVRSAEEGMEVARLLKDAKAVLLQGHGATSVGASLEEAVMTMLQVEEQARMNWYAYCAQGRDHRRIPDELLDEMVNRVPITELPHFKNVMSGMAPKASGAWNYFLDLVSR